MQHKKIAVGQMTATDNIDANFKICEALVKEAKEKGAYLLSLPENFAFFAGDDDASLKIAEPLDGPLLARYRKLAKQYKLWLSLGGFQEQCDEHRYYNTHLIIDDAGDIQATYRKLHLFQLNNTNGGPRYDEAKTVAPGDKLVVTPSPVGMLGLSICYDLRFAEMYIAMAQQGAEIMLIPAAFTYTTGADHWEILLRARAIESQIYVVAAAQIGTHHPHRQTWGHAMIVDPWGSIIAQCSQSQGIATADIDLAYLADVRRRMNVLSHRRSGIY